MKALVETQRSTVSKRDLKHSGTFFRKNAENLTFLGLIKFKMQSKSVDFDKIVCDNGSGFLKMGFAGDSFPRYTIPSIVGRPQLRSGHAVDGVELKDEMFGDEANPHRSLLDIKYPIEEG